MEHIFRTRILLSLIGFCITCFTAVFPHAEPIFNRYDNAVRELRPALGDLRPPGRGGGGVARGGGTVLHPARAADRGGGGGQRGTITAGIGMIISVYIYFSLDCTVLYCTLYTSFDLRSFALFDL